MDKKAYLDKLPGRIKYYLLEWKDKNMQLFLKSYGPCRLRDLKAEQLHELFSYATTKDGAFLANGDKKKTCPNCWGGGKLDINDDKETIVCSRCMGSGQV